jgi:hypothetical protein
MSRFVVLGLVLSLAVCLIQGLKIASALTTIEYTPELIASKQFYSGTTSFVNGGVANIVSDTSIDLAANAETQALRQYAVSKTSSHDSVFATILGTFLVSSSLNALVDFHAIWGKYKVDFPLCKKSWNIMRSHVK